MDMDSSVVIAGGSTGGREIEQKGKRTHGQGQQLSLIHISEPTRRVDGSRMPSSA